MTPDLTPLGFTPTETAAYLALLELGPATGYQVAKHCSIARANAYSALSGLVAKGAARLQDTEPRIFWSTRPEDLVARLARDAQARVQRLDEDLKAYRGRGAPTTEEFSGPREFSELAIRLATRDGGVVRFLGPPEIARSLIPVWRKRQADGRLTEVWTVGTESETSLERQGVVPVDQAMEWFGGLPAVLSASDAAVVGVGTGSDLTGSWGSVAPLVGLARMALSSLTRT